MDVEESSSRRKDKGVSGDLCSGNNSADSDNKANEWCSDLETLEKIMNTPLEDRNEVMGRWLVKAAVTYYHKEHGHKYKPVKIIYNTSTPMWNHINFYARPVVPPGCRADRVFFFAEVFGNCRGYFVNVCCIMDRNDPELANGCPICHKEGLHPAGDGYELSWSRDRCIAEDAGDDSEDDF